MDASGVPVHAASNRRSAFYAQDYTKKHGDIDFDPDQWQILKYFNFTNDRR